MKAVLKYLRDGASRPVSTTEFVEFWKSCTESDRLAFQKYAESQGVTNN